MHPSQTEDQANRIRSANADASTQPPDELYTHDDLDAFLESVDASKVAFRGALAALKACPSGGRSLTLAILNCGRLWWITSTQQAARQCNPIKKSGGFILGHIRCIRPVVQASDLAAAQDGLFAQRNRQRLIDFWGPYQFGGLYDSQAAVLVIVLLGQTRAAAGLPLVINFADEQFGFDVCPHNDIRVGTYEAGVKGADWMMKDDQLRMDHVRLAYRAIHTDWAHPIAGIGQGRRGSVDDFNTAARYLSRCVMGVSSGASIPRNGMQHKLLSHASTKHPVPEGPYSKDICVANGAALKNKGVPLLSLADKVTDISSDANRVAALDLCSGFSIPVVQYVDDNAMPCSSFQQSNVVWRACEAYSCTHGPNFTLGPKKSACLPNSHTYIPASGPTFKGQPVSIVASYPFLGVLLDPNFTFDLHLQQAMTRWGTAFDKLMGAGLSRGMPRIFLAAAVPERVESVALHGIAFCITLPSAESCLNKLQAGWARVVLGIKDFPQGITPFLITECRWTWRLGTRMFAEALMLEARVCLLPDICCASPALAAARSSVFPSWASAVRALRERLGDLPDITTWLSGQGIDARHLGRFERKSHARRFRQKIIYPALREYDDYYYRSAGATKDWPYPDLQRRRDSFSEDLLLASWSTQEWHQFSVWSLIRVTGRVPLPLYDVDFFPDTLDVCPLCGMEKADLSHALCACSALAEIYESNEYFLQFDQPWTRLRSLRFAGDETLSLHGRPAIRIEFVATVINNLVAAFIQSLH